MISNATEEAQRILREAKEYADQTMRDFQKFGKENVSVREMEQKRTALREKMNKLDKKKAKEVPKRTGNLRPQDLHLGDAVKVLSMNLKGTVSTRPDSKGNLFVQMGIMRTKVHISDLVLIDEAVITGPSISRTSSGKSKLSKAATISTEINLLGKTVDEAPNSPNISMTLISPICRVSALSTEKERAHCGKAFTIICAARNT